MLEPAYNKSVSIDNKSVSIDNKSAPLSDPPGNPSPRRRRSLLDRVKIVSMPPGFLTSLRKGPPTLVICLQQFTQPNDSNRIVSCSFAANFNGRNQEQTVGQGIIYPGASVGVILPVGKAYESPLAHPDLSHLVAYALHEMGLSPVHFQEQPFVLGLYAAVRLGQRVNRLFQPTLPDTLYPSLKNPSPVGLCFRVFDFAGRFFAINPLTVNIAPLLGETGLEPRDKFWRMMTEKTGHTLAPLITAYPYASAVGLDDTHYPTQEMAAEQARLALDEALSVNA